jgi:uncharacterized membrane protein
MDRELNSNPSFQNPSRANIEAIAQLERDALHSRSRTERFSENTVTFIGSITLFLLELLLMAARTFINLNL